MNYITPKLLQSRYNKCGGYHTDTFLQDGYHVHLTPQETSFGIYLKAIDTICRDYKKDIKEKKYQGYYQGKIESIQEILMPLAETFIDRKNMKISYSSSDFVKYLKSGNLDKTSYKEIIALMPYVIHYVALKKGFDFENPRCLVDNNFIDNIDERIVRRKKVKDDDMIKTIGPKLEIDSTVYLNEPKYLQ